MRRLALLVPVVILVISNISISAQDTVSKQPNLQVVIQKTGDRSNEVYELFYNPRELRPVYTDKIYGINMKMKETMICTDDRSKSSYHINLFISQESKNSYAMNIEIYDGPKENQNFPLLETSTTFDSLKQGKEILHYILRGDQYSYQVYVGATSSHAYQGGSVLQCSKQGFPVNIH